MPVAKIQIVQQPPLHQEKLVHIPVKLLLETVRLAEQQATTLSISSEGLELFFDPESQTFCVGELEAKGNNVGQVSLELETHPENRVKMAKKQAHELNEVLVASSQLHDAVERQDEDAVDEILNSPLGKAARNMLEQRAKLSEPAFVGNGDEEIIVTPLTKISSVVVGTKSAKLTGTIEILKGRKLKATLTTVDGDVTVSYTPTLGMIIHQLSLSQATADATLLLDVDLLKKPGAKSMAELVEIRCTQPSLLENLIESIPPTKIGAWRHQSGSSPLH